MAQRLVIVHARAFDIAYRTQNHACARFQGFALKCYRLVFPFSLTIAPTMRGHMTRLKISFLIFALYVIPFAVRSEPD